MGDWAAQNSNSKIQKYGKNKNLTFWVWRKSFKKLQKVSTSTGIFSVKHFAI